MRDTLTGFSHLSAALLIIVATPTVADYIVSLPIPGAWLALGVGVLTLLVALWLLWKWGVK